MRDTISHPSEADIHTEKQSKTSLSLVYVTDREQPLFTNLLTFSKLSVKNFNFATNYFLSVRVYVCVVRILKRVWWLKAFFS